MEVLAVFRDSNAHCAIRVDVTTNHTYFVENTGTEYAISKMRTQDFNHRFDVIQGYDPKRAAKKYLDNVYVPFTSAARTQLVNILENPMSETKTFRAPVTGSAAGAKTLPNKTQPSKTAAAKVAEDPKKVKAALKTAATTAKSAAKEAPKATPAKAEPKKSPAKGTAKASESTKASPKKATPAKAQPKGKADQGDLYATKVVATKAAQEAREGSFFNRLAEYAAKSITLDALIEKMATDKTLFREAKSKTDAIACLKVRCRDSFTRLGYLQAAK